MITEKMTTEQIRRVGLDALKRELGVVGMTRFLQMFETGHGDYTAERHQWLDHLTIDEIYSSILAKRQELG
jgi:hypothetical protein